jgi:xylulokinase
MFLLGFDIGSSSVKATLLDASTGKTVITTSSPDTELEIIAPKPGWAEQHPDTWWDNVKNCIAKIKQKHSKETEAIDAIGISYQMHGLVLVDKAQKVLRHSIIWCDSRAVQIGDKAFQEIGESKAFNHFLNSPGNFTASKLKWVKDNEPEIYSKVDKFMLPGDYIAMKLTGDIVTTPSGLSEGILWDFQEQGLGNLLLSHYGISSALVPSILPSFSVQGTLSETASKEIGLRAGIKISYRAGDQPNNALSLNVLEPGELASTAGTSGVIYGVTDKTVFDQKSRVNTFVHVNHTKENPRYGVLACINGTGILNSWVRRLLSSFGEPVNYNKLNELAVQSSVGADGLVILPYGNGAERTLENKEIGGSIHGLNYNRHKVSDVLRASQEGIVFALNYGLNIMRDNKMAINTLKVGNANMFLSPVFKEAFSTISGATIELYETDGSQGAARGAGIGAGIYKNTKEAFSGLSPLGVVEPKKEFAQRYQDAYGKWLSILNKQL